LLVCSACSGCTIFGWSAPAAPPPPAESMTLRGDTLVEEAPPKKDSPDAKLAGAQELFRRGDYGKACDLFHSLRDKKRYTDRIYQESTFYEAECLRLEARYPKACDTYSSLLKDYPNSPFHDQAVQHIYEIANYWLEDTRTRMKQTQEKRDKKRTFVDWQFVHFDKTKPLLDEEDRALEKLEQVHYSDITGNLGFGDRALFYAGAVKFFNEDYRDADHFLSQVHENYPNSPLAQDAIQLAIIAKTLAPGGADYDGRKVAEARALVDTALRNYPELAAKRQEFLNEKLVGIEKHQAAKDLKVAEFYRRRGKEGSAWFYYRLVQRRYPNTDEAKFATKRIDELTVKLQKQGKPLPNERAEPEPPKREETAPEPRRVIDVGPPPGPLPPQLDPPKPVR
jgi:outer membrane protein assembly factor BamD (BamD/ComL family)